MNFWSGLRSRWSIIVIAAAVVCFLSLAYRSQDTNSNAMTSLAQRTTAQEVALRGHRLPAATHDAEGDYLVGEWIKQRRTGRGWTQAELSRRANDQRFGIVETIRRVGISKFERGKRLPTLAELWDIAAAFHGGPFKSAADFYYYTRDAFALLLDPGRR